MKTAVYRFTEEVNRSRGGHDTWRKVELISGDPAKEGTIFGWANNVVDVMCYEDGKVIPYRSHFKDAFKGLVEFEVWHGK